MPSSDTELFKQAVKGVTRLSIEPRVHFHPPRSVPFRRALDVRFAPAAAPLSDDFEPVFPADVDSSLFQRPHIRRDTVRKLQRGVWRIQAELDLHYMRRFEARDALYYFLQWAARHEQRCVRVIHGKGWGSPNGQSVLKEKVRSWLAQIDDVMAFCPAHPRQGGEGAVIVLLRSQRSAK